MTDISCSSQPLPLLEWLAQASTIVYEERPDAPDGLELVTPDGSISLVRSV